MVPRSPSLFLTLSAFVLYLGSSGKSGKPQAYKKHIDDLMQKVCNSSALGPLRGGGGGMECPLWVKSLIHHDK